MAPSSGYDSPPFLKQRSSWPLFTVIQRISGLFLTLLACTILAVLSPFFLLIRLIRYLRRKSRRWKYTMRICSHQWPLGGKETDIGLILLRNDIDPAEIDENLHSFLSHDTGETEDFTIPQQCLPWTDSPLQNKKDLLSYINKTQDVETAKISVVHGFHQNLRENSSGRASHRRKCLILVTGGSGICNICVPRLLSIVTNQRMYLEIEPLPAYHFFVPFRQSTCFYNAFVVTYRFITQGPSSLLSLLFRGPSPLWKVLNGSSGKTRNRRRTLTRRPTSDQLMESGRDVIKEDQTIPVRQGSSHERCWRQVPGGDLLGRAERLLRASSMEMMLSLVAGTIRTHFRQQNIMHPPDLGVVVPVSCRNFLPVACGIPCDVISLPFMLPTGVEGAIPRVWSVQKRLYNSLNGHLPSTLKMTQILVEEMFRNWNSVSVRACVPSESANEWLQSFHSSHNIHVAFYRASGDLRVTSSAELESLLIFPSLSNSIKASFVFVQCGRDTILCATLCKKTFPNSENILQIFETETHQLLEHLSLRLLSLPQSTFLPGMSIFHEPIDIEVNQLQPASEYLRSKATPAEEETEKEYSLEELHKLLITVQSELDSMKSNPQGDRGEYIRKLNELEARMQRFHDSITERLGNEVQVEPEDGQIVDSILAPYKDASASTARRFSREFVRTDERKQRRASSFSP